MTKMFRPKINNPATPAAPAQDVSPPRRELGGGSEADKRKQRRKGRNSLRVDPQSGGVRSSGSGVNVPMK